MPDCIRIEAIRPSFYTLMRNFHGTFVDIWSYLPGFPGIFFSLEAIRKKITEKNKKHRNFLRSAEFNY
jgi:hypothetical protein